MPYCSCSLFDASKCKMTQWSMPNVAIKISLKWFKLEFFAVIHYRNENWWIWCDDVAVRTWILLNLWTNMFNLEFLCLEINNRHSTDFCINFTLNERRYWYNIWHFPLSSFWNNANALFELQMENWIESFFSVFEFISLNDKYEHFICNNAYFKVAVVNFISL